jgi:hypothetical protein
MASCLRTHSFGSVRSPPPRPCRSRRCGRTTRPVCWCRLRQLDVPLDAVRQVLDARDPEVTRKVLADHGAVLEARVAEMRRAIDDLYAAVEAPSSHTPVHRRHEPAATVLTVEGTMSAAELGPFLMRNRELLLGGAADAGAVVDGAFGAVFPTLVDDDVHEVIAFVPVSVAPLLSADLLSAGVKVNELPATDVAVLGHVGDYETIDETYRKLGAWVAAHAEPADLPVRELFRVGPWATDDPDAYRTEICWPLLIPELGNRDIGRQKSPRLPGEKEASS